MKQIRRAPGTDTGPNSGGILEAAQFILDDKAVFSELVNSARYCFGRRSWKREEANCIVLIQDGLQQRETLSPDVRTASPVSEGTDLIRRQDDISLR